MYSTEGLNFQYFNHLSFFRHLITKKTMPLLPYIKQIRIVFCCFPYFLKPFILNISVVFSPI